MGGPFQIQFDLADAEATEALGRALASVLEAGDCLLLEGDIGAGKTHLARALIQAQLSSHGLWEDVPSPTFTLVQTYALPTFDIWHCDLYRLSHTDELFELGLADAFETELCIVEWPDRLEDMAPASAIHIQLAPSGDGRAVTLRGNPDWLARLKDVLPNAHA